MGTIKRTIATKKLNLKNYTKYPEKKFFLKIYPLINDQNSTIYYFKHSFEQKLKLYL